MNDLYCWETKFKYCCYSQRLLIKLLLLNKTAILKINILKIKKAIYYARKYHGDQKRESGEIYYSHPLEVAFNVADPCFKTDILVTSILHDVIEDTALTEKMIEYIFDPIIASQVEALTRVKFDRKISAAETLDLLCIKNKDDLLLIKFFDRIHNIQTIHVKTPESMLKMIKETIKKFISLSIYLKATIPDLIKTHETMLNLCFQALSIKQHPLLSLVKKNFEDSFQLPFLDLQNDKYRT
jgi:guanosine-3',5'-bis(diphosphate) 3'-pyrophosphohydrolase